MCSCLGCTRGRRANVGQSRMAGRGWVGWSVRRRLEEYCGVMLVSSARLHCVTGESSMDLRAGNDVWGITAVETVLVASRSKI